MPEIGRVTREQAAALVGLAPYDDDSGEPGRSPSHRRRPRTPAKEPLCRSLPGVVPLESAAHGALSTSDRRRKAAQSCARRLRQKAPHLRQHRGRARNTVDENRNTIRRSRHRVRSQTLRPFLCSIEDRFFVPTCRCARTVRTDAVKAGRRCAGATSSGVARPCLDGGEHAVMLQADGTSAPEGASHKFNGCYAAIQRHWNAL